MTESYQTNVNVYWDEIFRSRVKGKWIGTVTLHFITSKIFCFVIFILIFYVEVFQVVQCIVIYSLSDYFLARSKSACTSYISVDFPLISSLDSFCSLIRQDQWLFCSWECFISWTHSCLVLVGGLNYIYKVHII